MSTRPVKTPQQANANWKAAMQSPQAQAKYTQGVNAVTQSPNAAAAAPAAVAKYAAATAAAVASGRMQQANSNVSLEKWKGAAAKGAQRLATGAANGADNHLQASQKMAGGWQAARDAANAIPHDGSEAASTARFQAAMRAMKAAAGKPSG